MAVDNIKTEALKNLEHQDWHGLISELLRLISLEPKESGHILNLASAYGKTLDVERQLGCLNLGLRRFPNEWKIFADRIVHILLENKKISEATNFIHEILNQTETLDKYDLVLQLPTKVQDDELIKISCNIIRWNKDDQDLKIAFARTLLARKLYSESKDILAVADHKDYRTYLYTGLTIGRLGSIDESLANLEKAITLVKDDNVKLSESLRWKAEILFRGLRQKEAIIALRKSINLDRTNKGSLQALYTQLHYAADADVSEIESTAKALDEQLGGKPTKYSGESKDSTIKLGFISQGFKVHPVGWMSAGFFCELAKREDVEYHIFDLEPGSDYIAKTIQTVSNNYHIVSTLNDNSLFDLIRSLDLHALIDCDGFQAGNRLTAILRKPAKINVKWIGGLIGSTYLSGFDYLITDSCQTPEDQEVPFTETIIRMPSNYVTYTPPPYKIDPGNLPVTTNGFITFGCFNNAIKITDKTLDLWSSILDKVPQSKLLLKDRLHEWRENQTRLLAEFNKRGITEERIQFSGGTAHELHLAAHNQVDICLDPAPYSGGLCTIEAIFMGRPVVALAGALLCHRHSATHLNAIGHPELIAHDENTFVQIAVGLAVSPERLKHYQMHLRNDLLYSPLLDHSSFADSFVANIKKAVT